MGTPPIYREGDYLNETFEIIKDTDPDYAKLKGQFDNTIKG